MDSNGSADDDRGVAEAAIMAALEGSSVRRCDLEEAAATAGADIDACVTRLVEEGWVLRMEGDGEAVYVMSSMWN